MLLLNPITCLAAAIYFESRGEIKINRLRVAQVILNRVESPKYPNTLCEVVKQKNQFTFYWDGKKEIVKETKAWKEAKDLAKESLEHGLQMENTCHYAQKEIVNKWTVTMQKEVHGKHAFYKGGC